MPRLPLLALLAALALSGCNRGDVTVVSGRTVSITQDEYRLVPQRVRVKPGRVTFEVRNASRGPHAFQVKRRGRVVVRIPTLLPGESGSTTVRLRGGTYRMFCALSHHEELGEYGTVSVR